MLNYDVTIPATVPQRSEIPEGLMNYSVFNRWKIHSLTFLSNLFRCEYFLIMMFKIDLLDDFPTAKGRGIVSFNLISLC